jgi:hypothetical protein
VVAAGANSALASSVFVLSFTLPSAGTWDVSYNMRVDSASGWASSIAITTPALALVSGSASLFTMPTGFGRATHSARVFITTTAATTYHIRAWTPTGNGFTVITDEVNSSSTVTWLKVA